MAEQEACYRLARTISEIKLILSLSAMLQDEPWGSQHTIKALNLLDELKKQKANERKADGGGKQAKMVEEENTPVDQPWVTEELRTEITNIGLERSVMVDDLAGEEYSRNLFDDYLKLMQEMRGERKMPSSTKEEDKAKRLAEDLGIEALTEWLNES